MGEEELNESFSTLNRESSEESGELPRSVVIVHDYLTQRGGAERVVLMLLRTFPNARLLTATYSPDETYEEFKNYDVNTIWTDRTPGVRSNHRLGLLAYPLGFSSVVTNEELTICTSSGFSHGVRARGAKLTYSFNPARWLYTESDSYLAGWPKAVRVAARAVSPALRSWDGRTMRSSDLVLTSSSVVQKRIRDAYGLEAEVVPPAAGFDLRGPSSVVRDIRPGFFLSVGRLLSYKNVHVLAAAMRKLPGGRLVIVGNGPDADRVRACSGANVSWLPCATDEELRWLYSNCFAVVSAAREDFGLTPIEGALAGRPAVVLRFGGFIDTVVDGTTGVFFNHADPHAVADALQQSLQIEWSSPAIRAHAMTFSEDRFQGRMIGAASEAIARFRRRISGPGRAQSTSADGGSCRDRAARS